MRLKEGSAKISVEVVYVSVIPLRTDATSFPTSPKRVSLTSLRWCIPLNSGYACSERRIGAAEERYWSSLGILRESEPPAQRYKICRNE